MSLFNQVFDKIKQNKELVETGKFNCIPLEWLPRMRRVVPGIMKGVNWIVTAGSGVK